MRATLILYGNCYKTGNYYKDLKFNAHKRHDENSQLIYYKKIMIRTFAVF